MPPKAVFSSHRTQELYEILHSLGEEQEFIAKAQEKQEVRQVKDKPKKQKPKKQKPKKKKKVGQSIHNPRVIPKFIKTDRWTIESSSSRSSKSTSKNKYPLTTRNLQPSNNYTPRSNLINIVDNKQSQKASIIQLSHSYDSYRKRQNSLRAKSRLFNKNKLESIKKTLTFVDMQTKTKSTVYNGLKLHSLAKCLKERNWLQVINQANQASFLQVDYEGFLEFQRLKMQQIKRGVLPTQDRSYLINYFPINSSQLLWQITNICQGRYTPKIGEIMQDRRIINYKSILASLQRWENVKHWIIKPLEKASFQNSHICFSKEQIKQQLKKMAKTPSLKSSCILQQYISNPVLYNSRKFSIKAYLLITSMDHSIKGYLYDELFIQTSSLEYREDSTNLCVHFTGNEIQRQGKHYGRYEENNRISEQQLIHHLQALKGKDERLDFKADIKEISIDLAEVIINKATNSYDYLGYFQLFQLDFLIGKDYKATLINVNQQPDLNKKHKAKYADKMVEDILKLTLDLQVPPPLAYFAKHNSRYKVNHFETIYDSRIDKSQGEPAKK